MSDGIYIAASGALARLHDLEIVANNLANQSTVGFKRDRTTFEAVLESRLPGEDNEPVPGVSGRSFTSVVSSATDFGSGSAFATGGALDVAIRGQGFFEIETPLGPRYTRAGAFSLSSEGTVVTANGNPVIGDGGPIDTGGRPVEVLPTGDLVDALGASIGKLKVVDFERPELLEKEGISLYRAPAGVEARSLESAELLPGSLESSNVEPVRELAALITLQRAFDTAMQMVSADDDITRQLIEEISG